jgi:hypothetical protein
VVIILKVKPKLRAMKALNWIGWISLGTGALIILFAGISLITGRNLFGINHLVSYFQAANSFILIAIALFIVAFRCECKK